jgi:hypothetical protein
LPIKPRLISPSKKQFVMAQVLDLKSYTPQFTDSFFFDNNIWMYLYCPIGNYMKESKQKVYSRFYQNLIKNNRTIWINSLILSEFANAFLRLEFDLWKKKPENAGKRDYKRDFIPTQDYKQTVGMVKIQIRNILKTASRTHDEFNSVSIENIFNEFGKCDFNDSYYLELARIQNLKIVTDDADFYKDNRLDVTILTAY